MRPALSEARAVTPARADRVLLVVPQPFYSDRGSPIAIREVVRAHLDLGHEVDIVTFPIGDDIEEARLRFFRAANPFGIRSVPVGFSLRKILLDLTLILRLHRCLREEKYDLVHALEEAAFPAVALARRRGIPVLYDMHSRLTDGLRGLPGFSGGPLLRLARRMEEGLFRRANLIVTSRGLADQVRAVHPQARIFEWHFSGTMSAGPESRPDSLRSILEIPENAKVVLYSGTFTTYQGVDLFLEAAAEVHRTHPDAIFLLVGCEPAEYEPTLSTAEALGIQHQVRIVERQPRDRIPAYFALADILVSPRTSGDNVPLKIFDYLAADRPIVATDIPTHRTVLHDGIAVLAPPTPTGLGTAIAGILRNPGEAETLRQGARKYAERHLGWKNFVHALREIHEAAVNGR